MTNINFLIEIQLSNINTCEFMNHTILMSLQELHADDYKYFKAGHDQNYNFVKISTLIYCQSEITLNSFIFIKQICEI